MLNENHLKLSIEAVRRLFWIAQWSALRLEIDVLLFGAWSVSS